MQLELYQALKKHIETEIPELKTVKLFNNQIVNDNKEVAFNYPCVLIEFKPSGYTDMSLGQQECDMIVTLHLGFKSFETEDIDILRLKQDLYKVVYWFEEGNWAKLARREERPNYDHDDVQVFEIDYQTHGIDFTADKRPKLQRIITPQLVVGLTASFT
jgi:hypothetical protein